MVTIDLLETWVHKGVFDHPRTGEDPPFQILHLPAGNSDHQLVNRPQHDLKENHSSDSDDYFDSTSDLSDDMTDTQGSKKQSYKSAGHHDYKAYAAQLRRNGVSLSSRVPTGVLALDDFTLDVSLTIRDGCTIRIAREAYFLVLSPFAEIWQHGQGFSESYY